MFNLLHRTVFFIVFLAVLSVLAMRVDADASSADENFERLQALEWREVGPYRGGRSAAVSGVPTSRNVYYMGATGGGVWKTDVAGQSWNNISDGFFGGSIGAVAVSEWDPNVIYVGGGEKTVRGNVSPGDGAWKSEDAGATWRRIGLEDSQHISRIRIHPKNPDVAYAAVMGHLFGPNQQRGVYKTIDGGVTWERILFVDEDTGAGDLAMDPTNPRILYAGFWQVRRTPYSLSSGGAGSGLYKSVDGGESWTELSENDGLPEGPLGAIGITVSPTNNQNLYAMIEAEEGGVFRSRDGGETWVRVNEERKLRQRAWYYTRLYADPADEENVYVLNVRFFHSKDGGKSFRQIDTPHHDNHDLWIDPQDPLRMIEANDGGANVSFDGGKTWSTQTNQPTAQMYRVSTDNAFPYRLLGGQQDDSAIRIRSRSATGSSIGRRDWDPTAGGESGHISAKPDNPDIVVGGSYGGYLDIVDHSTGNRRVISVWPDNPMGWSAEELRYRFQWNFPVEFSIHDPSVLYAAANVLFRSDDLGQSWRAISPDLTRNDQSRMGPSGGPITKDNTSVEYYGTIFALAQSPHDEGVLWAGSDDGRVHVTRNGGENWDDVTPRGLPAWAQINGIEADPFEPGGAYIAATRYKSDDFQPLIYRTKNWGQSWTKITNGIPNNHFTRAVRADRDRKGLLYAGTEYGVYFSINDGRTWQPLQLNLPIVPITDLAVKDTDLIAATQGRGYWILDDLNVLQQFQENQSEEFVFYEPGPVYRLVAGSRSPDEPISAGTNPYDGVVFYYELPNELPDDVNLELSVFDSDGDSEEPIWSWSRKPANDSEGEEADPTGVPDTRVLPAKVGLNRHVWDLKYPAMERFDGIILWRDFNYGPTAKPGDYRARLTLGAESQDVSFKVLQDPRSNASGANLQAQFNFVIESRDLLTRAHQEIRSIRKLREQTSAVKNRIESKGGNEDLVSAIEELNGKLDEIEQALYQTKSESEQDPLNFPIRLNNKLSDVMRTTSVGDAAPTAQAIQVKEEVSAAIVAELDALETIWREDVPAINRRFEAAEISVIETER